MKIIFISNYFTHHQYPFSETLYRLTNKDFFFIETEKMDEERVNMGWSIPHKPTYIIKGYEGNTIETVQSLINEADVVIIGSAPDKFIRKRLKEKKLIFRYSERIFKKKFRWYKWPIWCIKFYLAHIRHKNLYLLTASAYAAADYAKMFSFLGKTYKWGYFPETKRYNDINQVIKKKKPASILWVARLIELKHPDASILAVKKLKQAGYDVQLNLIGNGILENDIINLIKDEKLEDCVHLLGAMSPEKVREYMEQSEIFLFTSDRNEGWGAVLNEAMNSGCAVVASHAIGSVPFLIQDGENGFIYKDGDLEDLYQKIKNLLDNPEKRVEMGKKAYQTLVEEWNAENAAKRFCLLAESILNGEESPDLFENGICSKSKILKDDWYNG